MKSSRIVSVGLFGILGNAFLMLIKLLSGIFFHSQAMIADAVNSIMDLFSSVMTLMGGHIGSQPRDQDHQFGHGKAEFLFSLFVSMMMMFSSLFIFIRAIRDYGVTSVQFSFFLLGTCVITIFVKFLMYFYAKYIYHQTKSILVFSNMIDHRNDMVITFFTLLSVFFSYYQITILDTIVGVGIAIWIGYTGMKIFSDSYKILMDRAIDEQVAMEIRNFVLKQKRVEGITKFETTPVGYQYILILSILVDGNLKTFASHAIADQLEKDILKNFPDILMVS